MRLRPQQYQRKLSGSFGLETHSPTSLQSHIGGTWQCLALTGQEEPLALKKGGGAHSPQPEASQHSSLTAEELPRSEASLGAWCLAKHCKALLSAVLTPAVGFCHCPHFTDEESGAWRGNWHPKSAWSQTQAPDHRSRLPSSVAQRKAPATPIDRTFQPKKLTQGMSQEPWGPELDSGLRSGGVFTSLPRSPR